PYRGVPTREDGDLRYAPEADRSRCARCSPRRGAENKAGVSHCSPMESSQFFLGGAKGEIKQQRRSRNFDCPAGYHAGEVGQTAAGGLDPPEESRDSTG